MNTERLNWRNILDGAAESLRDEGRHNQSCILRDAANELQARITKLEDLLKRANAFVGYLAGELDADEDEIKLYKEVCEALNESV